MVNNKNKAAPKKTSAKKGGNPDHAKKAPAPTSKAAIVAIIDEHANDAHSCTLKLNYKEALDHLRIAQDKCYYYKPINNSSGNDADAADGGDSQQQQFQKIVSLEEELVRIRIKIIQLYARVHMWGKVLDEFEAAREEVKSMGNELKCLIVKAQAHYYLGDYETATKVVDQCIKNYGQKPAQRSALIPIYSLQKRIARKMSSSVKQSGNNEHEPLVNLKDNPIEMNNKKKKKYNPFDILPRDMVCLILSYLRYDFVLLNVAPVNFDTHELTDSNELWKFYLDEQGESISNTDDILHCKSMFKSMLGTNSFTMYLQYGKDPYFDLTLQQQQQIQQQQQDSDSASSSSTLLALSVPSPRIKEYTVKRMNIEKLVKDLYELFPELKAVLPVGIPAYFHVPNFQTSRHTSAVAIADSFRKEFKRLQRYSTEYKDQLKQHNAYVALLEKERNEEEQKRQQQLTQQQAVNVLSQAPTVTRPVEVPKPLPIFISCAPVQPYIGDSSKLKLVICKKCLKNFVLQDGEKTQEAKECEVKPGKFEKHAFVSFEEFDYSAV